MEVIAIASAVMGAIGDVQAGKAEQRKYNLQAKQTEVESQRKAIQYQQRSNDVLRRRLEANASIAAFAYAGGVDPFSGSPSIVMAANDTKAGREYARLLEDADAALRGGMFQAELYREAGETAMRTATFRAGAKLVSAGSNFFGGTQSPAPIESRNV